jgi:hypothetical protein
LTILGKFLEKENLKIQGYHGLVLYIPGDPETVRDEF